MPRDAFTLKIQRELSHPKCARKFSGLSRNGLQGRGSIIDLFAILRACLVLAASCRKCDCMLLKSYLFCPKCGNKILQVGATSSVISRAATTTSTSASFASFPATISNFETFRERKETERLIFLYGPCGPP